MSGIVIAAIAGAMALGTVATIRESRRRELVQRLLRQILRDEQPLVCEDSVGLRFRIDTINGGRTNWRQFLVAVTPAALLIQPITREPGQQFSVTPAQIRWFGRPQKYSSGSNELWLHTEIDGEWVLIRLRLYRQRMQAVIRALKTIVSPEQVTAYRRQRPYVHFGPVQARPATQDVLGAWTLADPVTLYLTPAVLVVLDGRMVSAAIPLETVQKVSAIKRLDQPRAPGLVRFESKGEMIAFALGQHEEFAAALAEAAKRTLEDPILWQRKKKKGEIDEEEDE